jgi:membrane protein implicated in regulation of membrane protease activity
MRAVEYGADLVWRIADRLIGEVWQMHHLSFLLPLLALLLFLFLPWQLALLVYVPIVLVSVVGFWKGLQALRRPPVTGESAMIGERAVVVTAMNGYFEVHYEGEIWRAVSSRPLHQGQQVVIEGIDGLTLQVAPVSPPMNEGELITVGVKNE